MAKKKGEKRQSVENKKRLEEKSEELDKKGKESTTRNEIYWIFGTMIFLIIIIFVITGLEKSFATFKYQGLTFTKEKFGQIPVYHYYYFFNDLEGNPVKYNLFLRNDPRTNNVPINGEIQFIRAYPVYISVNSTGLNECSDSSVAIATLAAFLTNNQIEVMGATQDKSEAEKKNNTRYITCENSTLNTVILIQNNNETKITKQGNNCHIIGVANCEILQAVEKFEVKALLDAKARTKK